MNHDLPSGDGDWELTDANTNPTKAAKYVVQAQRVGYTQRYNSPQEVLAALGQTVTISVNSYAALGVGMYCRNHLNPTRGCMDYRARFCCGKQNFWNAVKIHKTSWQNILCRYMHMPFEIQVTIFSSMFINLEVIN
jgi:hypothetical protein